MGRGDRSERGDCKADKAEQQGSGRDEGNRERIAPSILHSLPTPSRGGRSRDSAAGNKVRGPTSALEDLMRRKGVDEAWNALEEMQRQGATTDKYTVSRMLMKTVGDSHSRLNPPRVYRGISLVERFIEMQPKDVDEVLFNALLDTCCRLKDLNRLEATVNRMHELKVSPSPVTLGILVKTYGQAGDLQKVLQVWGEMEKQRGQANAVTYGCMLDACVKCGNLEKAVEIFQGMRQVGKHRNTILYTTLIKGYGLEKDLQHAMELFREMPQEGVPYNTITFNSILDACIKCGDLAMAEGLLREMTAPESSLDPDLITFSTLLKGYCHVGDLDKALQVAEAIKARGLRCDELVYNTLMDGCAKANDITAGVGLFEEMVQNGMRPSAITHSILARLYQRAGYEDDASEAVAQLYQNHGIERPAAGDRAKGFGRRWNPRSPNARAGDRCSNHSPLGSPSAASVTSGLGLHRERSDGAFSDGGWSNWSNMLALPGFECASAEPSAPSTPLGSLHGSPVHGSGPHLPMEALRGACVPPLPGASGLGGSPYSQASCTPVGSFFAGSLAGSVVGSPSAAASPQGGVCQQGFHMQVPPQSAQPGLGAFGTSVATQGQGQGAAPQLPPWPFPGAMAAGPPPPPAVPPGGEVLAMSMMQGHPASAALPMTGSGCFGGGGGSAAVMGSGMAAGAPQAQMPQGAMLTAPFPAVGPNGLVTPVQQSPFPMPLSPPHDLCMMGQPQAYFESWMGMGQQMGGGMQVVGGVQMGGGVQLSAGGGLGAQN